MKYTELYRSFLTKTSMQDKILQALGFSYHHFLFYIEPNLDVVEFLIFSDKVYFVQIIFQEEKWDQKKNTHILTCGLKNKKFAKKFIPQIDEILQYNLILYKNSFSFDHKKWAFKDTHSIFPENFYQVTVLNLYFIYHHKNALYQNLASIFYPFL